MTEVKYRLNILRDGAFYAEVGFSTDDPPRVDFSGDTPICGSMQCSIIDVEDIRLGVDEIQPMMCRDGEWTSIGVYRVTSCRQIGTDASLRYKIEAYDRSWVLEQRKTEGLYYLPAGTLYLNAVQQLLQAAGLRLVFVKDPVNASIPASAALATDREWKSGVSYLTIINDLLSGLGYRQLWFDSIGAARVEPYEPPCAENIRHEYSTRNRSLLSISNEYSLEEDYFSAPNKFVVIQNNPETGLVRGEAVNDAIISKKSTVNRGMVITQVTEIDSAYNAAACEEIAKRQRDESMMAQQDITFHTLNESGHGLGDVIALDFDPLTGVYMETGWTMVLKLGAQMKHHARRAVI